MAEINEENGSTEIDVESKRKDRKSDRKRKNKCIDREQWIGRRESESERVRKNKTERDTVSLSPSFLFPSFS